MFDYDPQLGWKFIAGKSGAISYAGEVHHYIQINQRGFRDPHAELTKNSRSRIMVLGDSFVTNISVGADDVFTNKIATETQNVDVLNFGVNGYNQIQEFLLLDQQTAKVDPDLIVLVIYVRNDFIENSGEDWYYPRPYASLAIPDGTLRLHPPSEFHPLSNPTWSWKIYKKSHLYTLLSQGFSDLTIRFQSHEARATPSAFNIPESYLCRRAPSPEMDNLMRIMEKLLMKFSARAKQLGKPLVYVIAPSLVQVDDDLWRQFSRSMGNEASGYSRALPNDRLMQFGREQKLLMLDLLPALQAKNNPGNKMYNEKEQHWSKEGNQVVADALLEYLRTNSLLP
ncbi:MAG: SGNH/GDSL hydrolase family protein [Sphingomonadales bacterium]|nr:SGNH/GDSL hydrolase family protein [Sphingomonadales bacterium]